MEAVLRYRIQHLGKVSEDGVKSLLGYFLGSWKNRWAILSELKCRILWQTVERGIEWQGTKPAEVDGLWVARSPAGWKSPSYQSKKECEGRKSPAPQKLSTVLSCVGQDWGWVMLSWS